MPTRGERWLLLTPLAIVLMPLLIWPAVFGLLASFTDSMRPPSCKFTGSASPIA